VREYSNSSTKSSSPSSRKLVKPAACEDRSRDDEGDEAENDEEEAGPCHEASAKRHEAQGEAAGDAGGEESWGAASAASQLRSSPAKG
jgi:hypothetical protein